MTDNEKYLKTALLAAKKAGKIFKANFGHVKEVRFKKGDKRDFVTEIDLQIEQLIRKEILSAFPHHKFIGEELGFDKIDKDDLVWIIDPIDGTSNFVRGFPFCCISLALWDSKGPLVGVVYNPVSNKLFSAIRGKGAYLNGKRLKVFRHSRQLSDSFGGIGWGRDAALAAKWLPPLLKQVNKARTLGSVALEICEIACGIFDFYVHFKVNIWDVAAGILVVQEAGGKTTDWQGNLPNPEMKNLIASNGILHRELLNKVNKL